MLHDKIKEVNGIYYNGYCEEHIGDKFSGSGNYFHDNGKIKGPYKMTNGLPDGHWEQFHENGTKKRIYISKMEILSKKIKQTKQT